MQANDILLNVVVLADYELVNDTINRTVIGVDARGVSLILEPNGQFSETNQSVHVTKVRLASPKHTHTHTHMHTHTG